MRQGLRIDLVDIRNAVCTALHAFNNYEKVDAAARFVDYNFRMVPKYWEAPELLEEYVQIWDRDSSASDAD
jgi:hypothetical protein